ncbi:MAG TPA: hypothetical protein VI589_14230 [Vicinamibacteria bacterium]
MRFAPPIGLALLLAVAAAAEDAPDRPRTPEARPAPPDASEPLFAVSAEEVRVDLVVRDKKGALVRGLTAGDVEVFEDGVRQDVRSVELVQAEPLIGADAEAPAPAYVAVVFDRLGPGARSFVREGLLTYLEAERQRRPHIGVFSIEGGLRRLAPFTDDPAVLRREADALLGSTPRSLADARERQDVLNAFTGMIEGIG